MAKRKRAHTDDEPSSQPSSAPKLHASLDPAPWVVQIVTGSYDRTLHGIVATLRSKGASELRPGPADEVSFQDNFLLNAHASSIRCLAISPVTAPALPGTPAKAFLATGGADERVQLYQLDASTPSKDSLALGRMGAKSLENPRNKEVGALLHHASNISALHFASKSKLLSAAGDSTIAVTRTRDWTMLSTFKAPIPQPVGRPSGDTAGPGETPAGINDFAVHPSRKLMISVGRAEKCMRLWNLMTGKKAGVLNFEKDLLQAVGEGRWGRGEGLKVSWSPRGDEFAVSFERGVAIFSMDSKVKGIIRPTPSTKVHHIQYVGDGSEAWQYLAISTENGRVLLYDTDNMAVQDDTVTDTFPKIDVLAQIGDLSMGQSSRVKDFAILRSHRPGKVDHHLAITGSSDGHVRLWSFDAGKLASMERDPAVKAAGHTNGNTKVNSNGAIDQEKLGTAYVPAIGNLLGEYATSNRITCLGAFTMLDSQNLGTTLGEEDGDGDELDDERDELIKGNETFSAEAIESEGSDQDEQERSEQEFEGFG